jgi:hypothetical protein
MTVYNSVNVCENGHKWYTKYSEHVQVTSKPAMLHLFECYIITITAEIYEIEIPDHKCFGGKIKKLRC